MRHNIVEGEPGIFPQPIASVLRWFGGLFRRGEDKPAPPEPAPPPTDAPEG